MLVYLMGLADIFAGIMFVTGVRPHLIMLFVASFLLMKGTASFLGKPNWKLYILGSTDIAALLLLWNMSILGGATPFVLVVLLFKGFVSFWNLKALRNFSLEITHTIYGIAKRKAMSESINNNMRTLIPKKDYSERTFNKIPL